MEELDDKRFFARIEELSKEAENGGYCTFSDFMDDHKRSLLSSVEGRLPSCTALFGGTPEAERVFAVFYPAYLEEILPEEVEKEMAILYIYPQDKRFMKRKLEHRDYLGAVLGTGIKREKIGDILMKEEDAYIFVKRTLANYLIENLTSVGPCLIGIREADKEDLPAPSKGEEAVVSVSSLRLDSLVARGFHLGRGDAAKLIVQGAVSKNGVQILDTDKAVTVGDKISVRGKGRIILREELGVSKSGRLQVRIERFTGKEKAKGK